MVFDPHATYCFDAGRDIRASTNRWTESENGEVSFERMAGGRCAGPAFTDPWTRGPDGVIAVGSGGNVTLVDAGGSVVRSTTQEGTSPNEWPAWSPDGTRIVFAGASTEGFDLYVMDADGTNVERVTDAPDDEVTPAWSPDGERILYRFDDGGETRFRAGLGTVRRAAGTCQR